MKKESHNNFINKSNFMILMTSSQKIIIICLVIHQAITHTKILDLKKIKRWQG